MIDPVLMKINCPKNRCCTNIGKLLYECKQKNMHVHVQCTYKIMINRFRVIIIKVCVQIIKVNCVTFKRS